MHKITRESFDAGFGYETVHEVDTCAGCGYKYPYNQLDENGLCIECSDNNPS